MHILRNLLLSLTALSVCHAAPQEHPNSKHYAESDEGPFTEEEFSPWVCITDMQMAFNNKDREKYWAYLEGRNYKGIDQFRWVEKVSPRDLYSSWTSRSHIDSRTFFNLGTQYQKQGWQRKYLNVYIDASGTARHQAMWVKPYDRSLYSISLSTLSAEKKEVREKAFTPWFHKSHLQARLTGGADSEFPLIVEYRENNEYRVIPLNDTGFEYRHCIRHDAKSIYEELALKKETGFVLLTLTECELSKDSHVYASSWVREEDYEKALELLKTYGISAASVELKKSKFSTEI